jgi:tRNA A37 threonylcarbamoyladenosine biosynthesis protein TsaE
MAIRTFHLLSNYEEYRDTLIHVNVHTLLVTEVLTLETEEVTLKSALITLQQLSLVDGTLNETS